MARLTPREEHRRQALDTLMRALGVKDEQLALRLGISRSAVQSRRKNVKLREDQVEEMAVALDVPPWLFDADGPTILHWLADNKAGVVVAASGWTRGTARKAARGRHPSTQQVPAERLLNAS